MYNDKKSNLTQRDGSISTYDQNIRFQANEMLKVFKGVKPQIESFQRYKKSSSCERDFSV